MNKEMDIYEELDPNIDGSFSKRYSDKTLSLKFEVDKYYSYRKLRNNYKEFIQFSNTINNLSKKYFDALLIAEDKKDELKNKYYFDLSCVYISEIQNIYLNPINNRQNQKKANWSIIVGIVSIIVGIIVTLCK